MRLRFDLDKVEKALVIILICLTVIHLLTWYLHFYTSLEIFDLFRIFDFDEEANIPTLFNTFLLGATAALLFAIGVHASSRGLPYRRHWSILSLVFVLLAVDELTRIHESVVIPIRDLFGIGGGPLYLAWVIPGSLFLILVTLFFARWLMHLPAPVRNRVLLAGALFALGAIGMEMLQGYLTTNFEAAAVLRRAVTVAEEFLEMSALIVMIGALVSYMLPRVSGIDFPGSEKEPDEGIIPMEHGGDGKSYPRAS